jgi:hypothetical protein
MPKFSVGQTVYHRSGKHSGKVVATEGDTVYFALPNGVEMDFRAGDLTAAPPSGKAAPVAEGTAPARLLTEADIAPEHRRVLAVIPIRTLQTIAGLYERQPKAGRFSAMGVAQKLNYIAAVTAIPYRTMKQFSDSPGELGLMMARGLSVSLGTANR